MKIGEFLIQQKVITQEDLDKSLELQKTDKSVKLGEIMVNNGIITKDELNNCIVEFMKKAVVSAEWLSQDDVEGLIAGIEQAEVIVPDTSNYRLDNLAKARAAKAAKKEA